MGRVGAEGGARGALGGLAPRLQAGFRLSPGEGSPAHPHSPLRVCRTRVHSPHLRALPSVGDSRPRERGASAHGKLSPTWVCCEGLLVCRALLTTSGLALFFLLPWKGPAEPAKPRPFCSARWCGERHALSGVNISRWQFRGTLSPNAVLIALETAYPLNKAVPGATLFSPSACSRLGDLGMHPPWKRARTSFPWTAPRACLSRRCQGAKSLIG